jgi:hypothetical protein
MSIAHSNSKGVAPRQDRRIIGRAVVRDHAGKPSVHGDWSRRKKVFPVSKYVNGSTVDPTDLITGK